jgi:hypothetical protein
MYKNIEENKIDENIRGLLNISTYVRSKYLQRD